MKTLLDDEYSRKIENLLKFNLFLIIIPEIIFNSTLAFLFAIGNQQIFSYFIIFLLLPNIAAWALLYIGFSESKRYILDFGFFLAIFIWISLMICNIYALNWLPYKFYEFDLSKFLRYQRPLDRQINLLVIQNSDLILVVSLIIKIIYGMIWIYSYRLIKMDQI